MTTVLLNTWFICITSLEEEINQFNITVMSYRVHKIQGSVVANSPSKLSKNLNVEYSNQNLNTKSQIQAWHWCKEAASTIGGY